MRIQRAWLRWVHFSHARTKQWSTVRDGLGRDAWKTLIPYQHVRREWRQELESWLCVEGGHVEVIIEEVGDGYWGGSSSHLRFQRLVTHSVPNVSVDNVPPLQTMYRRV